ncbi:LppA family lipoprotein [Gordonia sp. PKS22-38]|uniref:LppA family lipoprotein n=1 Tax=Gordonia prachuapensis TaxID=3115651 RepID=A0ABU7MVL4_9ACTN|nr:LppA family lipoprotein [Gordonia sp. PKS22-38]
MGVDMRSRGAVMAGVMVALGVAVGGCGPVNEATFSGEDSAVPQERVDELNAQLRLLPSLEATVDDYRRMGDAIAREISGITPTVVWRPHPTAGDDETSCGGEWLATDGRRVMLQLWISDSPIPDSDWPQALEVARTAAAAKDITFQSTNRDRPADHDVAFTNSAGAKVSLGSETAAVLSIRTPCRLPADAGSPSAVNP